LYGAADNHPCQLLAYDFYGSLLYSRGLSSTELQLHSTYLVLVQHVI